MCRDKKNKQKYAKFFKASLGRDKKTLHQNF